MMEITDKQILNELIESNKQIIDLLNQLLKKPYIKVDNVELSTGGGCNIHLNYELQNELLK